MAYATPEELAAAPYNLEPDNPELLLDRASLDVDMALLCSVYDAEDAAVIAALKRATLEQAYGNYEAGAKTGNGVNTPTSFSLGKLSVSKGTGGGNPAAQATKVGDLWSKAHAVLQLAGLTGQGPGEVWGYG